MGNKPKITAGMSYGTVETKLAELHARAKKIGGKVIEYSDGECKLYGLTDKNGKDVQGQLRLSYDKAGNLDHAIFDSPDGLTFKNGDSKDPSIFGLVHTPNYDQFAYDNSPKNGVVDAEEIK